MTPLVYWHGDCFRLPMTRPTPAFPVLLGSQQAPRSVPSPRPQTAGPVRRGPWLVFALGLLLVAGWCFSLDRAYEAGESRLLLRIRHLEGEMTRWQADRRLDVEARRCLSELDHLYQREDWLWTRYDRLLRYHQDDQHYD